MKVFWLLYIFPSYVHVLAPEVEQVVTLSLTGGVLHCHWYIVRRNGQAGQCELACSGQHSHCQEWILHNSSGRYNRKLRWIVSSNYVSPSILLLKPLYSASNCCVRVCEVVTFVSLVKIFPVKLLCNWRYPLCRAMIWIAIIMVHFEVLIVT